VEPVILYSLKVTLVKIDSNTYLHSHATKIKKMRKEEFFYCLYMGKIKYPGILVP